MKCLQQVEIPDLLCMSAPRFELPTNISTMGSLYLGIRHLCEGVGEDHEDEAGSVRHHVLYLAALLKHKGYTLTRLLFVILQGQLKIKYDQSTVKNSNLNLIFLSK